MRRVTSGSLTPVAFCSTLVTPICTTRLCVQFACTAPHFSNEPPTGSPFSSTCATLIGPERVSTAPKVRWTVPNEALHLLPPAVEQVLEPTVPFCSSQSSLTSTGPAAAATGMVVAVRHWPEEYVSGYVVPLTVAVSFAPTPVTRLVGSLAPVPKSTTARTPTVQLADAEEKYGSLHEPLTRSTWRAIGLLGWTAVPAADQPRRCTMPFEGVPLISAAPAS